MKLYVGNLPWSMNEAKLTQLFAKFGYIEDAVIIKDREFPRRSKGFGFVTFQNAEAGKKAIAEMDGKELEGRELKVNEAQPKEAQRE